MSFIRKQINEDVFLIVDKERNTIILEIQNNEYDLSDKIGSSRNDLYKGFFGFPITINNVPFGCGMYTGNMKDIYDLNNLYIVFYDYPYGSIKNPDNYKDVNVRKIFERFNGIYKPEKFMGYGNQQVILNNIKIPELDLNYEY